MGKNTRAQRGKTIEQRFWEKVEKSDGCWLWKSAFGTRGYGLFWNVGKNIYAHRFSWQVANASTVPEGLVVMHSCDNPACVNPAHLSVGTHKDNQIDKANKGRSLRGSKNPSAKLNDESVRRIRELYSGGGFTHQVLADMFGVKYKSTIGSVVRNKTWRTHG